MLFEVNIYGRIFDYIRKIGERTKGKLSAFDVCHPHTFHKTSILRLLKPAGFDVIRGNVTVPLKGGETIDILRRIKERENDKLRYLKWIVARVLFLLLDYGPFHVQQFKALCQKG